MRGNAAPAASSFGGQATAPRGDRRVSQVRRSATEWSPACRWAVISDRQRERSCLTLRAQEARSSLDGRKSPVPDQGFFLGRRSSTTSRLHVDREEEIFGPVASITPVRSLDEAIAVMHAHPTPATSIFTQSGKAARSSRGSLRLVVGSTSASQRRWPTSPSAAPGQLLWRPEGAWKGCVRFYSDKKVVISRWF